MDRRKFFKSLGWAPVAVVAAPMIASELLRQEPEPVEVLPEPEERPELDEDHFIWKEQGPKKEDDGTTDGIFAQIQKSNHRYSVYGDHLQIEQLDKTIKDLSNG
jgi:hypothetical protein